MYKQRYEDYKYVMQDVYQLYVGAKYTLGEAAENEEIPFKLRIFLEKYVLPDYDPDTTLESHFYYLEPSGVAFKSYKQVKTKVKINLIEEKKSLTGKRTKRYATRILPVEQFALMSPVQKEEKGVVIQEIILNKLALMTL